MARKNRRICVKRLCSCGKTTHFAANRLFCKINMSNKHRLTINTQNTHLKFLG